MARPSFSEMRISKMTDVSTPAVYAACAAGTKSGDVTLSLGRNEGGNVMLLLKYEMTNAMVSTISTSGGTGGAVDSLTLNFTQLMQLISEATQQKPDSTSKRTSQFGWDMTTNKSAS